MSSKTKTIVYYTRYCPDCIRALAQFTFNKVNIEKIDINQSSDGKAFVKEVNNGNASVPTIIFPDGSMMVEPSYLELNKYILDNLTD